MERAAQNIGATLKEGRYTLTHFVSSGTNGLNLEETIYNTWAAKDTQEGNFRCIRVYDSESSKKAEASIPVWTALTDLSGKHVGAKNVLSVLDSFWHRSSEGEAFCTVHPLHGPTLMWLRENSPGPSPWPASMVKSIYFQVLSGLAYMHEKQVVQGSFDDRDIVIGYPDVDTTEEEEITKLYGDPQQMYGVNMLNETGTGTQEEPVDKPFTAMIALSFQAFFASEPPKPASSLISTPVCNAPELLLEGLAGPEMDQWYLGNLMIAISFDNPPYTYNFTSMNGSPEERQVRGLVSARNTLGELPEEYLEKIKKKSIQIPPLEFDESFFQKSMTPMPEEGDEGNAFSEEEYSLMAALTRRLLQYKPEQRVTAQEALGDEFFAAKS